MTAIIGDYIFHKVCCQRRHFDSQIWFAMRDGRGPPVFPDVLSNLSAEGMGHNAALHVLLKSEVVLVSFARLR